MAPIRGWRRAGVASPWFGLALVAGSAVAFATTMATAFQGDDLEAILDATRSGPGASWFTELSVGAHLRPVLRLSLWLNREAVGLAPVGWHVANVVLHGAAAWLVAILARDLVADLARGGDPADPLARTTGLLAGVAFVVSPVHAEPVSWMVARIDPLLALAAVGSLLCWIRWRRDEGRPSSRRWLVASVGLLVVALYTKESATSFVVVLVAFEAWVPRPGLGRWASLRRSAGALGLAFVATAAYLAHYLVLDASYLTDEGDVLASESPLLVARRGLQVAVRSVLPAMEPVGWALAVAAAVAVVVALGVLARRGVLGEAVGPHRATFGFLATALVVVVAPVARLGVSPTTTAGERLAYLPSVFATVAVALALALVVARAPRVGWTLAGGLAGLALVLLVVANQTYVRGGDLMEGVVGSQAGWPVDEPVVALVAPDRLGGSWGGRNALGPALVLEHGWSEPPAYVELATVDLGRVDDALEVRPGPCPRCLTVSVDPASEATFSRPGDDGEVAVVETGSGPATVTRIDARTVEVELPADLAARLVVLDGGRFVDVEGP